MTTSDSQKIMPNKQSELKSRCSEAMKKERTRKVVLWLFGKISAAFL